jgi:hypothetical protein
MTRKILVVAVTGMCLLLPALADESPPENNEGRYIFNKVADGYLRLDSKTGEVSLCSRHAVGWACIAVPKDRAVLENEITRLRAENGTLKKDLLGRGLPLPPGTMPEQPRTGDGQSYGRDHTNFGRVMTFVDRLWHRLVDAIARAQKQVLSKS